MQLEQLACQRDRLLEVLGERPLPIRAQTVAPDLLTLLLMGTLLHMEEPTRGLEPRTPSFRG
jgi:hypothetical protein